MKYLILLSLIAFCNFADAQSVLLGKTLIGKGDSATHVREAAGEPAKLDRIDGDESSPAMEIWTYRRDDQVITLWMVAGKVVKAAEKRNAQEASGGTATR